MLPVPVALFALVDGRLTIEASNRAFHDAGFALERGPSALVGTLGAEIEGFLASDGDLHDIAWQAGDPVECRHYNVTLARAHHFGRTRCLATLIDRTAEVRTEQHLRREMLTDSLTGLPNRAGFSDRLESMIEAGRAASCAVLVVDLDRFSRVNACLGALAGDELLITVARRIKGALRARDTLARLGGDEFGILMTIDEEAAEADRVAERIRGALATPFRLSDLEFHIDCAIGVAFGTACLDDPDVLIRHAQFAVKRSKTSGLVEAYHPRALTLVHEQFEMETALRRALDNGDLRLSFQPICDLGTGRVMGFEALSRWIDERGIAHPPADFIPVAEESGLIVPLGRWALDKAAATLAEWDARSGGDCGVRVAVNLSAIQLQRDDIASVVERVVESSGLTGERLTLELTESAFITDPDRIARAMHALKEIGCTLAMDDFGTGYSNLAYLQKLPIDALKIDQSFVIGLLADRDKVAIVRAILSLAQALGMKTTAEGVETLELAQTLTALGCTYGQGYAFARALDPDAAYAHLIARNHSSAA
ncbi:putative bifunctional diguanylate cyclase/phosphodiesterase [Hephaestia sp. GCM10023244]|uniref:putative bifunctional diguanylate cyclase/phosphodiesterase n=1 Tax=unclassified Hephaestia TaxID=2631281 RepID=UPI002077389D|nr:EAL domain-containing protein [Hephaestia sp. MAHUQ-44]MCM8731848.1 EAL domain-containing protein [Hephaestia sp. MAHUQ-44]